MRKVNVALEERSYPILIGEGLLSDAGKEIARVIPAKRVVVVTDKNVAKLHYAALHKSLEQRGITVTNAIVDAGESSKSFKVLEKLSEVVLAENIDRKTTLVALGGGVIGDLAGFTASILLRGIPFIQIPTTLLAMVDSSVGGKTGINTKHGKNLIGSFYQPRLVLVDTALLKTLPKRERLAGYAEIVKYGLINDKAFFTKLEKAPKEIGTDEQIAVSCRAKAAIVALDEKESGPRALLNLGHTFGHALEAIAGYDNSLLHGEGVAIGMAMAFRFSAALGVCSLKEAARVEKHLKATGLPVSPKLPGKKVTAQAMLKHMMKDKKNESDRIVLILARAIGDAYVDKNVPREALEIFLKNELKK